MTVKHPKPINQSPMVLLLNANELIRDVVEDRVLDDEPLSIEAYERLEAWVDRAIQWSKDYGAYTNREYGEPSDV
tara:strand:- start:259 stop:483 length:225 start_codon:yes stop_codon:yes gene_type:complete